MTGEPSSVKSTICVPEYLCIALCLTPSYLRLCMPSGVAGTLYLLMYSCISGKLFLT